MELKVFDTTLSSTPRSLKQTLARLGRLEESLPKGGIFDVKRRGGDRGLGSTNFDTARRRGILPRGIS